MTTPAAARLTAALADRYRIERELGAGGMATVYLAEDVRHHRRVAIKVLHPELSAVLGPDRFLKEIELTANLQHPHILPLFDSGAVDGLLFYVMPFVEGETLRSRLTREHQLPIAEAVRIATDVAGALEYAHKRGVIHRDIKPENILLHEGRPQVADFGIALAVQQAGGSRMTQTGMSLGTPQYMAPEQAMGDKGVDARADVYALGAVTYEMLAGEPPFTGPTAQAIVAKVMTETPRPLRPQRPTVPAEVEGAVLTALQKLPADRFDSAAKFAEALGNPAFRTTTTRPRVQRTTALTLNKRWLAVAAITGLVLASAGYFAGRATAPGPEVQDVGLPDTAQLAFADDGPFSMEWPGLVVSPDGDFVVYVARVSSGTELWYRSLRGPEARPLPGTRGALIPALSPDGRWIGFQSGRLLKKVGVDGKASAIDVAEVIEPYGMQWTEGDEMLLATDYGTRTERIRMSDGTKTSQGGPCAWPIHVPGTNDLICHPEGVITHVRVVTRTDDGTLPESPTAGVVLGDSLRPMSAGASTLVGNQLLFVDAVGNLLAARYEPARRAIGPSRIVRRGLRRSQFAQAGHFGVTRNGDLVYVPGSNGAIGQFAAMQPGGAMRLLPIPAKEHSNFGVSRDGKWLAATSRGVTGDELWIYDVETGQGDRAAVGYYLGYVTWAPDGTLAFERRESATSEPVTMLLPPGGGVAARIDGPAVEPSMFVTRNLLAGGSGADIMVVTLDGNRVARADTLKLPSNQYYPVVSPDRRWVAYAGAEKGISQVFVTPFPSMERQYKVSVDAASEPLWLPDGRLVYRTGQCWYGLRPRAGAMPPFAAPTRLFCDAGLLNTSGPSNTVMPDGSILYLRAVGPTTAGYVRIVRGWQRSLGRAPADDGGTP